MLRVEGITKTFGGLTALDDVSFAIAAGSVTGIIGPNGAGKTTLFNVVSGIEPPTSGRAFFAGEDATGLSPARLARRGMVRTFQGNELFGRMTVLENVMVGLYTKSHCGFLASACRLPGQRREERRIREEARGWLEFAGIARLAGMRASHIPFGSGRLLEIARALALGPRLILMDEPAAGLNARETAGLADLIGKMHAAGVTVALVEHDMELVMDVCERIVVLNLGRKLAEGTPREIQEDRAVVRAYLGED
jgi:ABC-type branched-subunit amino acid transport system ATPase component